MSTIHLTVALLCGALAALQPASARADVLKPFKDELFSAQTVLETRDGGDFTVIDYQELRDINGRDQVPERRAKRAFVDPLPRRAQANETLTIGPERLEVFRAGEGTAFTVIFIHGRDGDRRLGANDYTFGGNFNRLKNLALDNGGTYYAPTVRRFDSDGVRAISALIGASKGRVVLACASMGSFLCWGVTREPEAVKRLSGMMILGGATDPDFTASAAYKAKLPMWFSHGSRDKVYAAADQIDLYSRLHAGGYPARFTLFETGSHGTPVRMSDWRAALNWILAFQ